MYQLYYSPGACSMAVHAVLNELNQPVELIASAHNGTKTPEFLKANPRGMVPVLVDDGHVIREGAAIILYLLDKHKSALLPREGFERATALEWLMFGNATLHPAYGKGFGILKSTAEQSVKDAVLKSTVEQINKLWADVDAQLAKNDYLAGKNIGAADILITVIANWSGAFQGVKLGDNVKRLLKNVSARPSFQKALAAEKVEYKAAA